MRFTVVRKVLLKDTGRELAHLEKQLRTGHSISTELTVIWEIGRFRTLDEQGARARAQRGCAGLTSAPVMTRAERIANVQRLGYGQTEAEFLALVTLHGGSFVGGCMTLGSASSAAQGAKTSSPICSTAAIPSGMLSRTTGRASTYASDRCTFRVGYPENVYFATEREKVAHVCDERGIDHGALPVKLFRGPNGASSTRRYFLDRFSLFTRAGTGERALCYFDSEFETNGPFAIHLRRHLPLFAELPSFELVSVTTASTRLGQAQTVFERVLSRGRKWLTKVADPERLLADFRDRQLFEIRETSNFDWLRIDALRDDIYCFSGRHFARMLVRWETSGDELIRAEIAAQKMPNGRVSCFVSSRDYDLFGRVEEAS